MFKSSEELHILAARGLHLDIVPAKKREVSKCHAVMLVIAHNWRKRHGISYVIPCFPCHPMSPTMNSRGSKAAWIKVVACCSSKIPESCHGSACGQIDQIMDRHSTEPTPSFLLSSMSCHVRPCFAKWKISTFWIFAMAFSFLFFSFDTLLK